MNIFITHFETTTRTFGYTHSQAESLPYYSSDGAGSTTALAIYNKEQETHMENLTTSFATQTLRPTAGNKRSEIVREREATKKKASSTSGAKIKRRSHRPNPYASASSQRDKAEETETQRQKKAQEERKRREALRQGYNRLRAEMPQSQNFSKVALIRHAASRIQFLEAEKVVLEARLAQAEAAKATETKLYERLCEKKASARSQ